MLDKLLRPRTMAGIVVALVVAAGTAVAATSTGPRPTVVTNPADEGSTTTAQASITTSTEESTTTTVVAEAGTTTTTTAKGPAPATDGAHPQNHGACVSAAAHDTPPGPGHGAAVSKVARSDCGKSTSANGADSGHETPETEAPGSDSAGA